MKLRYYNSDICGKSFSLAFLSAEIKKSCTLTFKINFFSTFLVLPHMHSTCHTDFGMKIHSNSIHKGLKQFSCKLCNKKYTESLSLKCHITYVFLENWIASNAKWRGQTLKY